VVEPAAKRDVVAYAEKTFQLSQRRACRLIKVPRSTVQYKKLPDRNAWLRRRLQELASHKRRYGAPRLHYLIRREGKIVNHKRLERVYREEGLSLRKRKKRRHTAAPRVVIPKPEKPNKRWSMDFASDNLAQGRKFRCLTIVDDCSRESPAIEVDTSLPGKRVRDHRLRCGLESALAGSQREPDKCLH
jgi:putative transposase